MKLFETANVDSALLGKRVACFSDVRMTNGWAFCTIACLLPAGYEGSQGIKVPPALLTAIMATIAQLDFSKQISTGTPQPTPFVRCR
jgi:hypothetical protein